MNSIIKFFLVKSRLNYTLFIFLFILGIVSYNTIPKDVFPPIKIDKISVSGDYSGASIDTMDKMAVIKLEKEMKSLNGVKKIESFIKNGSFSIILTLEKGLDKNSILNKVKDMISNNKGDLPSDMDEPIASIIDFSFPLINVTVASNEKSKDELIEIADKIKTKFSSIENVSKVELHDSTNRVFEIILDTRKVELYNLDKQSLFSQIRELSYIFPIGKIEDKDQHLFLSTTNGKKEVEGYLNTLIKVGDKTIYLSDIARVERKYEETDIISRLNGKQNVELGISKNEKANAIKLAEIIKAEVKKYDEMYEDVDISVFYDTSVYIKNRLNTVISGIMFGLILVSVAMYLLINKRVAFIVVMGIPTAILLGVLFLSFTSYSINMITLIGALLILGVLVDDAVILAENVQRHIKNGEDKLHATIQGTKEVIIPVFASSLTTVFAFIPMMILTGEIGEFLLMIPIAIIILIIASLLESFVFLPIHAYHILDKNEKELDWTKAQNIYKNFLLKILRFKKTFLFLFVILIPFLTISLVSNMRYQMFPDFDSDKVFIKGKFEVNHSVQDVYEKTKVIEQLLLSKKDELSIKTISYTSGLRTDNQDEIEIKPTVFQFNMELHAKKPTNFVDEYITPILSFDDDTSPRVREKNVNDIVLELKEILKVFKPEGLVEFAVKKEGAGITANDIEIYFNTKDQKKLLDSIELVKTELGKIDGVIFVDDTAKFGVKELKIAPNSYGEALGFTEAYIATSLSPLFLESEQAKGLDKDGIFKLLSFDIDKDSFARLKDMELTIPNTESKIALSEVSDFTYVDNFDSIYKKNTQNIKSVVANVNNKIITAVEALELIEPTLEKLKKEGVDISFGGEAEQNEQMAKEMTYAFFITIGLIFIALLVMFDSFRLTFVILSIIPFSVLGAIIGHYILGVDLSLTSVIGILGLAGVVINNAIVMIDFIKSSTNLEEMIDRAKLRLRPIIITSITTFLGLSTLIFYATGQAKILQPLAISLGFGLIWGTVLTLIFLPALYAVVNRLKD